MPHAARLAAAGVLALAGCGSMPMTADEFRDEVGKSSQGKIESFDVDRPVAAVGQSLQRKAAACLNFKLTPASLTGAAAPGAATIKSTVTATAARVELDVQVKAAGNPRQAPPDGNYLLVAIAEPAGTNKTHVQIYRGGGAPIAQAVRAWAGGDERSCPDPKRTFDR